MTTSFKIHDFSPMTGDRRIFTNNGRVAYNFSTILTFSAASRGSEMSTSDPSIVSAKSRICSEYVTDTSTFSSLAAQITSPAWKSIERDLCRSPTRGEVVDHDLAIRTGNRQTTKVWRLGTHLDEADDPAGSEATDSAMLDTVCLRRTIRHRSKQDYRVTQKEADCVNAMDTCIDQRPSSRGFLPEGPRPEIFGQVVMKERAYRARLPRSCHSATNAGPVVKPGSSAACGRFSGANSFFAAAFAITSQSRLFVAIGFSHSTWRPASKHCTVCRACR